MSLHRYGYGYQDPVNRTDRSGYVPDGDEIKDRPDNDPTYTYSLDCGWIDWAHAGPRTARRVLGHIKAALEYFRHYPHMKAVAIKGTDIQHTIAVPLVGDTDTFTEAVVVFSTISEDNWLQAAMAVFREVEWAHENSLYSHASAILESWTQFSEEDLTSDLIGFYRALDPGNWEQANAFSTLAPLCGFSGSGSQSKCWSERVFKTYPNYQQVGSWESPRLVTNPTITAYAMSLGRHGTRQWPSALRTIQPNYGVWDLVSATSLTGPLNVADDAFFNAKWLYGGRNPGGDLPIITAELYDGLSSLTPYFVSGQC